LQEVQLLQFIFMLTHHDRTVDDAVDVYRATRACGLKYVGFKDIGASYEELRRITALAHEDGCEVILEVVSTTREDERRSLSAATEIGVDWVLGGTNPDLGMDILGDDVKYCPFAGTVVGHPSILKGATADIAEHAKTLTANPGVHGIDLLAYRHADEDPEALTASVVRSASGPVIVAGSIASAEQIAAVAKAGAWGFTVGGAVFEASFGGPSDAAGQVEAILELASTEGSPVVRR
jgi:hypothetical protein